MIDRSIEQHFADYPHEDAIAQILGLVRPYMSPSEINMVVKAYQLALETCQDVTGIRPIPPLEHALAVTTILAQMMHVDAIGISAGMVFEAVDADLLILERVEHVLGAATARVVESMARLNILERKKQNAATGAMLAIKISQKNADEREELAASQGNESKKPRVREALRRQQTETVRKMFVAMADDPRVVLLKLAYRLHAMRLIHLQCYHADPQEIIMMAQETRDVYAPLAGRLGMSKVECELDDLAFEVLEPEQFAWVRDIVEMERKQWRSYVDRVCGILRSEMASIGVKAEVSGRVKHAYSFYRKLVRMADGVEDIEHLKAAADISQIHDLIAFRILVDSTTDCYIALGHVHSLWKPKEGRIKDFIANPKPNGYRALHTTIFCLDEQLVEIQIRTHEMHEMAEYGVAMHWHYKDVGDNASSSAKELLTWLHQLSEWQQDLRSSHIPRSGPYLQQDQGRSVNPSLLNGEQTSECVQAAALAEPEVGEPGATREDFYQEQIFVFTPKGDVKDLPAGATPLDFAYRIHSMVGDRCAGARILTPTVGEGGEERLVSRMVPLDYELKSGEIVDIVTSRSAHPTRDWLNFARTSAARNKIRRYVKIHERPINIQIGRERLDRELKMAGPRGLEAMTEDAENTICRDKDVNVASFDDVLAGIGSDDIRPHMITVKLLEYWRQRDGIEAKEPRADDEDTLALPAISAKTATAQLEVAGVTGLLTRLANCCNPLPGDSIMGFVSRGKGVIVHRSDCRNISHFRAQERERLINVTWRGMSPQHYNAPIIVVARDRGGLIRDIAAIVADVGANLLNISCRVNYETALVSMMLEIDNLEMLQRAFARLEKVKGVTSVARDMGARRKS